MGCNFYLRYKTKMSINTHNDLIDFSERITELDNGYVYNNHYYETLPEDFAHMLHIGKSSAGWHFSLCIYPSLGINNLNDWKNLFSEFEIEDEYGDIISKEEMLERITDRKGNNYKMSQDEKDTFCRQNHCDIGINGLFAHKTNEYSNYVRTSGTYDLTENWDFC